jgi:hypothetical protein
MITDRYFTDEEFEKNELKKRFKIFYIIPLFLLAMWGLSYIGYTAYEIKPIYLFIYLYMF